jgi:hypothetical protein
MQINVKSIENYFMQIISAAYPFCKARVALLLNNNGEIKTTHTTLLFLLICW